MIMKKILFKLTKIFSLLIVVVCLLSIQNIVAFSQDTTDATDTKVYLPLIQDTYTPPENNPTPTGLPSYTSKLYAIQVSSDDFFVTTNGSANGDGSMDKPWDLDSALLGHSEVRPGDIIWVRGGTYRPVKEPSKFNIKVSGSEDNPVVIRAYPGERVTIKDAGIQIYNPNVVFWGFEVFSSGLDRVAEESGSHPGDFYRPGGIAVYSDNVALINNIIHDAEYGITAQISIGNFYTENAVIYGNLSYNNGWKGPDRGHGYGLYGQNELGTKYIYENIIFNNFGGYSYHIYRENGPLKNFIFFGNIALNGNFLVGGLLPTSNIRFEENYTYNATTKLGFSSVGNETISVQRNHFWSVDSNALDVKYWKNVRVYQNNFYSTDSLAYLLSSSLNNYDWNENLYHSTKLSPFTTNNSNIAWEAWKKTTGFDSQSKYYSALPNNTNVTVRPNIFEAKRGNIIIQNWSKLGSVSVNISNLGLEIGDKYTIHNAQNFYVDPIVGTYDGNPITIPMNGWTVAIPIGWDEPLGENTFPSFGTFVLITKP